VPVWGRPNVKYASSVFRYFLLGISTFLDGTSGMLGVPSNRCLLMLGLMNCYLIHILVFHRIIFLLPSPLPPFSTFSFKMVAPAAARDTRPEVSRDLTIEPLLLAS